MPTCKTDLEIALFAALKRITQYDPPGRLHKRAPRDYGLDGAEAVEMAYENVLGEARAAIKSVRLPRAKPASPKEDTPDAT